LKSFPIRKSTTKLSPCPKKQRPHQKIQIVYMDQAKKDRSTNKELGLKQTHEESFFILIYHEYYMKIQTISMLHHCFQSQKWHPKVDVLGRFDSASLKCHLQKTLT